jgi:hypothetical protein
VLGFLNVLLGAGLLVAGRKLFWLLVGAIGFLVGIEIATHLIHTSQVLSIVVALAVGIAFALLAVFLETVAIGLAGFLGGGFASQAATALLGFDRPNVSLIAFVGGGILGVVLVVSLFNWALITISSLAGASMIVRGFGLLPRLGAILYVALFIIGLVFQGMVLRGEGSTSPKQVN